MMTHYLIASSQIFEGYGCREGNLPDEVRVDCHPEPEASPLKCRHRGCVWCDKEGAQDVPICFFRDPDYGAKCDVGYVRPQDRVECRTEGASGEQGCRYRNCTWCPTPPGSSYPSCFISATVDSTGYLMVGEPQQTPNGLRVRISKSKVQGVVPQFENEIESLILDAHFQSDSRLRIKIMEDGKDRYEVPLEMGSPREGNANPLYSLQFQNNPSFSFKVVRKSTGTVLFDSSAGKLQFADQFLSLTWSLPSENVYGIGENEQRTFKHDFDEKLIYSLYANGDSPLFTAPIYGVHPHYTVLEDGAHAHALMILNSNAQEFHMLPGPTIKYITIGGILDLNFFLGPTPHETVQQYTEAVGKSQMPPYWGLGFQLCRWGYDTIENLRATVDRQALYGIPHDVQYLDIDVMRDKLDFTYDTDRFAGLPDYIRELKGRGIRFVTILDPMISMIEGPDYEPYTLGEEMDVWVKKQDGSPVVGRVWPHDNTAPGHFPDFSSNSTQVWWSYLVAKFHDLLEYDGLWIDMNEPANFENGDLYEGCAPNQINYPPYVPGYNKDQAILHKSTLCGDHVDSVSIHYNTHSLYGHWEAAPTLAGARLGTGKRSMVLSRSTFVGSGRWTNHWLGDNWSQWSNLHFSIIGVLQFNLWGIPYVGADICGHQGDSNAALCQRWHQLGAFYPFSRNHNTAGPIDQDPGSWGPEVAASTKAALEVRYTLLPYLYTLFYEHVTLGGAVFRPLWYNYPNDTNTLGIDRQFMWGTGILVSPVLEEATTQVNAYFPNQRHYSYFDGSEERSMGGYRELEAPLDFIPVHVVGGNILPTQQPARNTMIARNNTMGLVVALDGSANAQGSLFYDDGESIETHLSGEYFYEEFVMSGGTLRATVLRNGYPGMASKILDTVRLLGSGPVTTVVVNNGLPHREWTTEPSGEVKVTNLQLNVNANFTITFS